MSTELIELDGSMGEGGGQILRSSLALSLLTGKGFHLSRIRAGRPRPGLQPQHLMSVRSAATIGQARAEGVSQGSRDLIFRPGIIKPGRYRFDIGTAGATGLVLHTLYLPLTLGVEAASELMITGGTHVSTSPCYHFLQTTWRGYLEKLGFRLRLSLNRPGFYPRGGGEIEAVLQPCPSLQPFTALESPLPTRASVLAASAGLPDHVGKRLARRAKNRLEEYLPVEVNYEEWQGGPGCVLAITLDTTPVPTLYFALGERGKPAEAVADEAVEQVLDYLAARGPGRGEQRLAEGVVDEHSADQLVLPLALGQGPSSFSTARITRHLLTNLAVIRSFLDREIVVEGEEGKPGRVILP